jgi:CHAT domain-containing protein
LQRLKVEEAVLVPGGWLGLLPLHAAWREHDGRARCALDEVAFSYAPSAQALAHAQRIADKAGSDGLLAVEEPLPVSAGRLPGAAVEVSAITALYDQPTTLRHTHATRQAVLARLPSANVFEFAGHAATDWADPLRSGLLLADDEMLTVQDVFDLHLNGARLATLPDCETGIVGTRLPDEVVALPAAFLRAGFAGVVATLWSVADDCAAMLMQRFYHLWRKPELSPAQALQQASRWLRQLPREDVRRWLETCRAAVTKELAQFEGPQGGFTPQLLDTERTLEDRLEWLEDRLNELEAQPDPPFAHPVFWAAFAAHGA